MPDLPPTRELTGIHKISETGKTYTFTVAAFNANGAGPGSDPSNAVIPT